jgi:hypothetical protein
MDFLQKKLLRLLPELLHHFLDFIWLKSGRFQRGWIHGSQKGTDPGQAEDELAPFIACSTVWPEQCRAHVDMQHYDTWHLTFSQWCWWEFKSCRLLMLCHSMGGSQHSEGDKNIQNNRNHLQSQGITAQNTQILTMSPVVSTLVYISTKVVSICSRSFHNSTVL